MAKLTEYKALTFDCYGTLIDWESGIWDALQPLLMANQSTEVTRGDGLGAFAECESAQQSETPDMVYPMLLRSVHQRIANQLALRTTPEMDEAFRQDIAGRVRAMMGDAPIAKHEAERNAMLMEILMAKKRIAEQG